HGALASSDVASVLADLPLTVSGGGQDVGAIRPTV
ncbi:MAG: asparaginase, partial [Microbacterium sp.]